MTHTPNTAEAVSEQMPAAVPYPGDSSSPGVGTLNHGSQGTPRPDDSSSLAGSSCITNDELRLLTAKYPAPAEWWQEDECWYDWDDGPTEGFYRGLAFALVFGAAIWAACFGVVWLVKEWLVWMQYL